MKKLRYPKMWRGVSVKPRPGQDKMEWLNRLFVASNTNRPPLINKVVIDSNVYAGKIS